MMPPLVFADRLDLGVDCIDLRLDLLHLLVDGGLIGEIVLFEGGDVLNLVLCVGDLSGELGLLCGLLALAALQVGFVRLDGRLGLLNFSNLPPHLLDQLLVVLGHPEATCPRVRNSEKSSAPSTSPKTLAFPALYMTRSRFLSSL